MTIVDPFHCKPAMAGLLFAVLAVCGHGQAPVGDSPAVVVDIDHPAPHYSVASWDTDSGLPQNTVHAILQTRDGHIWAGTSEGVARFNGTEFTGFNRTNTPEFPNSPVTALLEAPDGTLWIATDGSGIARFRNGRITRNSASSGLLSSRVFALALGLDGSIWIGTSGGVNRFKDGRFTHFTEADGLGRNMIRSLHCARSGELWVGTSRGLDVIKDGAITNDPSLEELKSRDVRLVFEDAAGARWLVTNSDVVRQHGGKLTRYTALDGIVPSNVESVLQDRSGTLWLGASDGLFRFERGRFVAQSLRGATAREPIQSLHEDRESNLWLGTNDGLKRIRQMAFTAYGVDEGLSHNMVASVCQDTSGAHWVATMGGGLNRLSGSSRTVYTKANGLLSDGIRALCPSREGGVWVGFDRSGVVWLKDGKATPYTSQEVFRGSMAQALHEDAHGTLWIGTRRGLCSLKDGTLVNHAKTAELSAANIRAFAEDAAGRLWIGTNTGLVLHQDGKFSKVRQADGLSSSGIRALYVDGEGVLWIGTNGSGLSWLKDGKLSACTTKQGLYSDTLLDIVDDAGGHLWISSRQGVFRVAKQALDEVGRGVSARVECVAFNKADGMLGVEGSGYAKPAAWRSSDGRLSFATVKALVTVDPSRVKRNEIPPPVVINRVRVDGVEMPLDELMRLSPGQGELEFGYAALSYVQPERIRFKYKLDGVNENWVNAGARQVATYSAVPPGRHRFQVQAMNSDGVWNLTGASFEFFLAPRFYQTWWFYGAMVAFLGSGTYGIYTMRVRSLRSREQRLVALVQERTAHLDVEINDRKRAQEEVAKAQRELLEISRQAGMAEVATGVLHNVGNVLNSVNVSATLVLDQVRESKAANLSKIGAMLQEHAGDLAEFLANDPKGRKIPAYLITLAGQVAAERETLAEELGHLRKNIEHIKDIVAMQQSYAKVSGVSETVEVSELVEDALRMNASALARHGLEIVRDYQPGPPVTLERHKVLQVLVNLIRNAKHACDDSGRPDKQVIVRILRDETRIRVTVIDNGIGIPPENLTRIFAHGFTTKKDGHGFGLHSGALVARELGGSLLAHSDGPNRGASFTLELPVCNDSNS